MATYALTIAGVPQSLGTSWSINWPANGVATFHFSVYSISGSYVPALDAVVAFTENASLIFAGTITGVRVRGIEGVGLTPIESEVTAESYHTLADRRYFSGTLSGTLKSILQTLVPYIPGISLDAAQATGPTLLASTYVSVKVRQILDKLTTDTGYLWRIDFNGYLRMYAPGTFTAPFAITDANRLAIEDISSEPLRQDYANVVRVYGANGLIGTASDAGEIAAHGIWELAEQSTELTTQAAVDARAAAMLTSAAVVLRKVVYDTDELGLEPGQTQTITVTKRSANNTYLVTEIDVAPTAEYRVRRRVTAIEGVVYRPGWRTTVAGWNGATSSTAVTGTVTSRRPAYFLGGNGTDFVQSATPTWVEASPIQVQITWTADQPTATVTGRLRAISSGVSVQARLYDVTDASFCTGASAVVTDTAWTVISFVATLNTGSHYYQLKLLPGAAGEYVGAVAYVE